MMDLRAAIGAAVNAQDLSEDADRQLHVDRIMALGMVGGHTLSNRLSALLWRLREGRHLACRNEAALVFASWLRRRREVREKWHVAEASNLIISLARLVVLEWEHEDCIACGGATTVPHAPDQAHPRGWRERCDTCDGTGRSRTDHPLRVRALGVRFEVYEKYWRTRFDQAHGWLADVDPSIHGGLRKKLAVNE